MKIKHIAISVVILSLVMMGGKLVTQQNKPILLKNDAKIANFSSKTPHETGENQISHYQIRENQRHHDTLKINLIKNLKPTTIANFRRLKELNQYVERDLYDSLLKELSQHNKILWISAQTILNHEFAKNTFGNDQAWARLQAIAILKERAKTGDYEHLEFVLESLVKELSTHLPLKGQDYDLIDLISAWIETYSREKIYQDPEVLFSRFSYQKALRRSFVMALHSVYGYEKTTESEFQTRILPLLEGS